jgi:hypothetical protein
MQFEVNCSNMFRIQRDFEVLDKENDGEASVRMCQKVCRISCSESSALGDVLHSFFGYSDAPTPLQLLVYVAYLAIAAFAYLGLRGRARTRPEGPQPAAR